MSNKARQVLVNSAYKIVRALAVMLLKQGISYPIFSDIARKAFTDASQDFEVEGRKLSDSRIAILTGLSRKEIKRLKELADFQDATYEKKHNRAVRIVTAWNREQKYLTSAGKPRVLPVSGNSPSLHELVTEFGGGVPTRAVIDELSRVGAIVESRKGYWRLENPAYLPKDSDAAVMNVIGADVPLLIKTINHNLEADPKEKLFQRKVMYQEIPETEARKFRKYAADESFKLLKKLDRWLAKTATRLSDKNANDEKRYRVGISAFYFEDKRDEEVDNER